jgi:SNF family Na+-dependent transporter
MAGSPKSSAPNDPRPNERRQAIAEFRRIMTWILAIAVLMVIGAVIYLGATGDLTANLVIATTLGVFFSVLLGCGLFAAAFFSDKSGHDQSVDDATDSERHRP